MKNNLMFSEDTSFVNMNWTQSVLSYIALVF